MQKDAVDLIQFWYGVYNIPLPNEYMNLYMIESAVYRYKIQDIIRISRRLKESDLHKIVELLQPRPNIIEFNWNDKLISIYSWIVKYFHPDPMDWIEFNALISLSKTFDVNLICGTAQKLLNSNKTNDIRYLKKVIESDEAKNEVKREIQTQFVNARISDIDTNTSKKPTDTSEFIDVFRDSIDEI